MPGSSELSDALNPYYFQDAHLSQTSISPDYDQHTTINASSPSTILPQHQHIFQPHRSELADAINPAALSPSTATRATILRPTKQISGDALQLLKGLIQSIASYKAAVEQEKKRRLFWEQEQETKNVQRQAELEKRVADLQRELDALKAEYNLPNSSSPSRSTGDSAACESSPSGVPGESVVLFDPPPAGDAEQPEFVEGSSSSTLSALAKQPSSGSPHPSPENASPKTPNLRSARAQTIQAAMRNHILACMGLETDKELPPSHKEGILLRPTDRVRFAWEKTTKKCSHNARMKSRIIDDLIASKDLYPLVSPKDFALAKLEGVFEQSFMTLRQKYATQRGVKTYGQDRAENKARKARRLSRKKIKLANRSATRATLPQFDVPEFDCAFQLDCMSSEESSEEETEVVGTSTATDKPSPGSLRIRFLAWRSTRLQELYREVDEHEQVTRESRPKRGVGRKDRHLGPPKDGNPPPPMGTPRWMVSKKWLRQACAVNPQIATIIAQEDENTITNILPILGDESDDEQEIQSPVPRPSLTPPRSEPHAPPSESMAQPQPDFTQMHVLDYSTIGPMMPMQMPPETYQQAQYDMYAQQGAWVGVDLMSGYVDIDLSQFSSPMIQYPSAIQQQQQQPQ